MRTPRLSKLPRLAVATLVAAAGLGAFSAAAAADSMPGMTAEQHAHMSSSSSMPGMTAEEHAHMSSSSSMPGMTAEEHAHMSADSMPGMDMSGGATTSASSKRPVALALIGFGLLNGLVLLYAGVIRRRPAAVKRRETLARVRAAASKPNAQTP